VRVDKVDVRISHNQGGDRCGDVPDGRPINMIVTERGPDFGAPAGFSLDVQLSLQITSTGLGGSFIEPGIPPWERLLASLAELLLEDWIKPAAAVYRYDPFLRVRTPEGKIIGNSSITLFERMCSEFARLGISRVTTSRADSQRYPAVAQRVRSFGLEWMHLDDRSAAEFCLEMDAVCRSMDLDFSVCCEPPVPSMTERWGCIDAKRLNRTKGDLFPGATEILHNKIGKQANTLFADFSF